MRTLDRHGAEFGNQYRQANQQQAVDAQRRQVLTPQRQQPQLRKKAAQHRQRPVQQQGHGRHANEVIRHARIKIAPDQPQGKQAEHRPKQQVLATPVGEQLYPAGAAGRPEQQWHVTQPAQREAGA
ncbi:hypothetical protein D3C80_1322220 [compost metagenome]